MLRIKCRLPISSPLLPLRHLSYIRRSNSHLSSSSGGVRIPGLDDAFSYRWLRDSCQCSLCIHPSTQQKLHRTSDIPDDSTLSAKAEVKLTADSLLINWQDHTSTYPLEWLRSYSTPKLRATSHFMELPPAIWDSNHLVASPDLFVKHADLQGASPHSLLSVMTQLIQYGIIFIKGVPTFPNDDLNCEARKLGTLFGIIRDTFYGEVWNVKRMKQSTNIAYTDLDLGLHMDLLYFEHPPRYQILHCLHNRVNGGNSYFVDAFLAAHLLRKNSPEEFETLTKTPVPYHYVNNGHNLHYSHPIIELDPARRTQILHINYSPPFQAPLEPSTPPEFYDALEKFTNLLTEKQGVYEHLLQESDVVIFDNRRVLHARRAFSERPGKSTSQGETSRWLQGCYFEADDMLDRYRVLRKKTEDGS